MVENKLQILLITFNRSWYLEHTLGQLLQSPFARCKITILDNRSSDDTPSVCQRYQALFPNMTIVRHKRNIGGDANIMRAVEYAESEYAWVLADDDLFDFSDCGDVLEEIWKAETDLVYLYKLDSESIQRGQRLDIRILLRNSRRQFQHFQFLPSTIFKTNRFDFKCIYEGYNNIRNHFPYYLLYQKAIEENYGVYISATQVVSERTENRGSPGLGVLEHFRGFAITASLISDNDFRKRASDDVFLPKRSRTLGYVSVLAVSKLLGEQRPLKSYLEIMLGLAGTEKVEFLFALLVVELLPLVGLVIAFHLSSYWVITVYFLGLPFQLC